MKIEIKDFLKGMEEWQEHYKSNQLKVSAAVQVSKSS